MATTIRFDAFEADLDAGILRRAGVPVRVQDLPFRLLAELLAHPGELVTRAALAATLWEPGLHVDAEAGLNTAIAKLRDALGDTAQAPRFIETIPKRGYRFIAPIEHVHVAGPGPAAASPPSTTRRPVNARAALVLAPFAAALALLVAAAGFAASRGHVPAAPVRVAVALFDNETGDAAFDRLAQVLTDATVVTLAADPRLAVIGNAAVLRTDRPFRDLAAIRDALGADLIVIGQVQRVDADVRVLTHLIRAADQAHVWVRPTPWIDGGEAALARSVSEAVGAAVRGERARGPAGP